MTPRYLSMPTWVAWLLILLGGLLGGAAGVGAEALLVGPTRLSTSPEFVAEIGAMALLLGFVSMNLGWHVTRHVLVRSAFSPPLFEHYLSMEARRDRRVLRERERPGDTFDAERFVHLADARARFGLVEVMSGVVLLALFAIAFVGFEPVSVWRSPSVATAGAVGGVVIILWTAFHAQCWWFARRYAQRHPWHGSADVLDPSGALEGATDHVS